MGFHNSTSMFHDTLFWSRFFVDDNSSRVTSQCIRTALLLVRSNNFRVMCDCRVEHNYTLLHLQVEAILAKTIWYLLWFAYGCSYNYFYACFHEPMATVLTRFCAYLVGHTTTLKTRPMRSRLVVLSNTARPTAKSTEMHS